MLFAGITVVIAICGLAIAGIPAVTIMGLMAALTVAVMVAISLTLLPALLGFAGHKIDAPAAVPGHAPRQPASCTAEPRDRCGTAGAATCPAHPWRYLIARRRGARSLTAPVAQPAPRHDRQRHQPESLTTRRAYDLLAEGFGAGFNGPLLLSVELDGADARAPTALDRLEPRDRRRPRRRRRSAPPQVNARRHRRGRPR